jgi:hypothetical protein
MARIGSLLRLVVRVVAVVPEAREDAALLWLWLRLVVQAYLLKPLLGHLLMALAVAGLLHRRAGCGARTADIEGTSGVYRAARIERLAGVRLVDIVLYGRARGDVLC